MTFKPGTYQLQELIDFSKCQLCNGEFMDLDKKYEDEAMKYLQECVNKLGDANAKS